MSRLKNVLPLALAAALSSPTFAQVRSYLAGTAGNPSAAPNPTAQGWFLIDPTGGAAVRTDVSPDGSTGRNAWQIDTGSAPGGGQLFYEDFLTQQELDDAVAFLLAEPSACIADVTTDGPSNGTPDGAVTLSDFSFYLSLWGAGCP